MGNQERDWCEKENLIGFEVSAKLDEGIQGAMEKIVSKLISIRPKKEKLKLPTILNRQSLEQPQKRCCG